ncbi:hypothetical protein AMTRI_Chr10g6070 [Amborella trichopoda]|uniref:Bet v I/Major latex protein domain-containing protein n=1 Tax=Amborella trichopoda TaxID=13333 RepID=W1NW22_AMBTC|nr:MLP-like protein 423 [Amborella trichopoda]ERM99533.1 hypothetical protein AMTR_s00088p00081230 [Amborella trichopoda]|eukprot:XP_006836680.1 MLP-like protein 423 [Amborella trichopoda]
MAGSLPLEVALKSPADKFWAAIRDSTELFPKIFPDQYKSIKVVEGDGKSVGSIRVIDYAEGMPVSYSKEKIKVADDATKKVTYAVVDGDILSFYKVFEATLQVVLSADAKSSVAKWDIHYEKANPDVPEPNLIQDLASKTFKALDDHVMGAA